MNVTSEPTVRGRILRAAFSAFMERGYERASTLDIATRAKVSKRELYAHFENKQAMLIACILERAKRMRLPLAVPAVNNQAALVATLNEFGSSILREVSDPKVLAVFRLAIAESDNAPEIARSLDKFGRDANRDALIKLLAAAQAGRLIGSGDPSTMAGQFLALIWGDLLVRLLLRVTEAPKPADINQRVGTATEILFAYYPPPVDERRSN